MNKQLNKFIRKHAKTVEIFVAFCTLLFIAVQTVLTNRNLEGLERSLNLAHHEAIHRHKQRINQILIEDDKTDQLSDSLFSVKTKDIVGFVLINDYESLFNLMCKKLLDAEEWSKVSKMMRAMIRDENGTSDKKSGISVFLNEQVNRFDPDTIAFDPGFVKYLDDVRRPQPLPPLKTKQDKTEYIEQARANYCDVEGYTSMATVEPSSDTPQPQRASRALPSSVQAILGGRLQVTGAG